MQKVTIDSVSFLFDKEDMSCDQRLHRSLVWCNSPQCIAEQLLSYSIREPAEKVISYSCGMFVHISAYPVLVSTSYHVFHEFLDLFAFHINWKQGGF